MLDHRWTSFVDGGPKLGHYMLFAEKLGHDRRSANYFTVRVANIILMLVTDVNWFTVSSSRESILTLEWSQPPMMTRQHRSVQKLNTCCTAVSTFHHLGCPFLTPCNTFNDWHNQDQLRPVILCCVTWKPRVCYGSRAIPRQGFSHGLLFSIVSDRYTPRHLAL